MQALTIVVVDDEPGIRSLMYDVLSARGHLVITADDGVQAVEVVSSCAVDVVFLDIRMPGGDGLTALKEIHALKPSVLVVMITGCGEMSAVDESMRSGSVLCLAKPFSMRDVLGVLDVVTSGDLLHDIGRAA